MARDAVIDVGVVQMKLGDALESLRYQDQTFQGFELAVSPLVEDLESYERLSVTVDVEVFKDFIQ